MLRHVSLVVKWDSLECIHALSTGEFWDDLGVVMMPRTLLLSYYVKRQHRVKEVDKVGSYGARRPGRCCGWDYYR
jgi:hypothetical protein